MRWHQQQPRTGSGSLAATFTAALLLLQKTASAADLPSMLDCSKLIVDNAKFDFSPLKGPHTITTSEFHPPTFSNTTYTLDLCAYLKRSGEVKRGDECPNGTKVCAIKHFIDPRKEKDNDFIETVIPIAGNLKDHGGKAFDWTATRLKSSDAVGDKKKEGVRIVMKGGVYEGREQKAVVEMVCDPERKGDEGEWESEDRYDKDGSKEKREEEKKETDDGNKKEAGDSESVGFGEKQLKKENTALIWEGYTRLGDVDTLQLTWYTKYACEKRDGDDKKPDEPKKDESRSWGFFTWMVILVFMATASYLIFGSWLNYNRYGARGWDLLPHGDTLRDLPYLLKDWVRRLLNTMQGSGSRGGYSAV